jgi:cytochrome c peroxidase
VLEHYNNTPRAPLGHSELKPLHLTANERRQIIAFLGTLNGPVTAPPGFLTAPANRTED